MWLIYVPPKVKYKNRLEFPFKHSYPVFLYNIVVFIVELRVKQLPLLCRARIMSNQRNW